MLCLSRAAHDSIFRSWSKRTTSNEAKTSTYAIFLFINAFLNERSRQAGRKSLRRLPARVGTGRSVGSSGHQVSLFIRRRRPVAVPVPRRVPQRARTLRALRDCRGSEHGS